MPPVPFGRPFWPTLWLGRALLGSCWVAAAVAEAPAFPEPEASTFASADHNNPYGLSQSSHPRSLIHGASIAEHAWESSSQSACSCRETAADKTGPVMTYCMSEPRIWGGESRTQAAFCRHDGFCHDGRCSRSRRRVHPGLLVPAVAVGCVTPHLQLPLHHVENMLIHLRRPAHEHLFYDCDSLRPWPEC